jgi:hypothetical protein
VVLACGRPGEDCGQSEAPVAILVEMVRFSTQLPGGTALL